MGESAATLNPYVLYSMLGFIALMGTVMMGAVLRLMFLVGRMDGRLSGLKSAVADLRQDNAGLRQDMTNLRQEMTNLRQEISNIWRQLNDLTERVAENRGLLRGLHDRIDLMIRHRHDDATGDAILMPAVPDPAAD